MHDDKIEIAIVGGGETGTPLLRQFLAAEFVEVTGIADLDAGAPGMQIAGENGISTTNDFMDLVSDNAHLDIIIDVSGAAQVRTGLRQHLQDTGNRHTVIMNEVIVRLLMSLSNGELMTPKHGKQGY